KNWRLAFEPAGYLEQFGRRSREFLQGLHESACVHLDRLEAFGKFPGQCNAVLDEVDGFGGLARFRGPPPRQFLAQDLNRKSRSREVLTQTVMKVVAQAAPLAPAHFQKLALQPLAFCDLLAQVGGTLQDPRLT